MRVALCVVLIALSSVPSFAQTPERTSPSDTNPLRLPVRLFEDARKLAAKEPLLILAIGGGAAALVHLEDGPVLNGISRQRRLEEMLDAGNFSGSQWIQFGIPFGVYGAGEATRDHGTSALGTELLEAEVVNGVLTQGIKFVAERGRPAGGHDSFPSGHTSGMIAMADVLEGRFGWKVGLPAYGAAVYVAMSRLTDRQHWPSDTVFGAAVGLASSRAVQAAAGHRHAMTVAVVPTRGGAAVWITAQTSRP